MTEHESTNGRKARFSRREALRLAGGVGAAGLMTAGWREAALAREAASASSSELIEIIDTGAELPTEEVTFRWLSSGPGPKGMFFERFIEAYQEAHPNITVELEQFPWNEIAQIVPLGVQNRNVHDLFQIPPGVTGAQAVREGWVAPLDDLIPNFAEWKATFPPGLFVPGITDFDGKTYTVPIGSDKRYGTLLLYNVEYMEQAGYDPAAEPLTWDEFRDAARIITEQGQGQYYGLIIEGNQVGRWAEWVGNLAQMAGATTTSYMDAAMNWQTGQFVLTSDEHLAAVELLLAIRDDGSVFPGSLSLNAHEARARMPQGAAGMILQGPWNIPQWQEDNPDFGFGVATQPLPNEGTPMPLSHAPGGANHFWLFAESPYGAIAGDILHQIGTEPVQTAWATITGGVADPPAFPEAALAADLNAREQRTVELFEEQLRLRPEPLVRNPEVAQVQLEWQTVTPNFGETIQGIYTGQLDPQQGLQDVEDRFNAELDRAIAAAQEKGADVSRDDWVFPNWDPTQDYTDEDYAEL